MKTKCWMDATVSWLWNWRGYHFTKTTSIEWVDMFGDEPTNDTLLTWVVSKNLHRRHLTTSQRATVAVEMETLFAEEAKKRQATSTGGKVPKLKANLPDAATGQAIRDKAAAAMQVSPRLRAGRQETQEGRPKGF